MITGASSQCSPTYVPRRRNEPIVLPWVRGAGRATMARTFARAAGGFERCPVRTTSRACSDRSSDPHGTGGVGGSAAGSAGTCGNGGVSGNGCSGTDGSCGSGRLGTSGRVAGAGVEGVVGGGVGVVDADELFPTIGAGVAVVVV